MEFVDVLCNTSISKGHERHCILDGQFYAVFSSREIDV